MKMPKLAFNYKSAAKYAAILVTLLIFCRANILGVLTMFGVSLAFALIFCGYNPFIICLCYLLSGVATSLTLQGLICAGFSSVVILLFGITTKAIKKSIPLWAMLCFCGFAQICNLYFAITTWVSLVLSLLSIAVSVAVSYFLVVGINAALNHRLSCLASHQKVACCIGLLLALIGVCNINLFGVDFSCAIFCTLILMCALAAPRLTFGLSALMAAATLCSGGLSVMVCQYVFYAGLGLWLAPKSKLLAASSVCLVRSVLGLILDFGILELVPCLIAAVIFVGVPTKYIKKVGGWFFGSKRNLIAWYYSGRASGDLKEKLTDMAGLYQTMATSYQSLVCSTPSKTSAIDVLVSKIKMQQCENCAGRANCYNGKDMTASFCTLLNKANTKGKVNLLDVPNLLATNCTRVPACLGAINSMAASFADAQKEAATEDENNLKTSLQMQGTSEIFKQLATQFKNSIRINGRMSAAVKNSILASGLVCTEAQVLEDADGVSKILVVVRHNDAVDPKLAAACSKAVPLEYERRACVQTPVAGWSIVEFVPSSRYSLVCGCAASAKQPGKTSGDNYIYQKLNDNKYLFALSDGMGHGDKAANISNAAINLISGFYKCGMGGTLATDSVNSLLLPISNGVFATLDVAVVDTFTGQVDFVKMGSSVSIIKGLECSQIVGVESLPLGVSERVAPTTCSHVLQCGDIVVLASDGIVDAFANDTEFSNFVNNLGLVNMQIFAESIYEEACGRQLEHKDDMTVLAFRLTKNR